MKQRKFQIIEMQNDILNELSLDQVKGGFADGDTCRDGGTLNSCTGGGNLCGSPVALVQIPDIKPNINMW